jgi:hypothetical protein
MQTTRWSRAPKVKVLGSKPTDNKARGVDIRDKWKAVRTLEGVT